MKAIGADKAFSLEDGNQFYEVEKETPQPGERELLVNVKSISVNPVDTKLRQSPVSDAPRILGFDAVGTVEAVGEGVEFFSEGDEVYYSGTPDNDGSNATHQLVDERMVGRKPANISNNEAASLPLTAITASEVLFDVFNISHEPEDNKGKSLLIINGAGGVGSIATQIAKYYGLKVITTASRSETTEWSEKMGADVVLNHKNDLADEFEAHGIQDVDFILCTFSTDMYYEKMVELVRPRGHIATLVELDNNQDLNALKDKSITFTHEFMYTRPICDMDNLQRHHDYLTDVTEKMEAGHYQTTLSETIKGLTPDTLFEAHQKLEAHQMIGKLVIELDEQ